MREHALSAALQHGPTRVAIDAPSGLATYNRSGCWGAQQKEYLATDRPRHTAFLNLKSLSRYGWVGGPKEEHTDMSGRGVA